MDAVPSGVCVNAFDPLPPSPRLIASICRCPGGHTGAEHAQRAASYAAENTADERRRREKVEAELAQVRAAAVTSAATSTMNYTIERACRVGDHLVMQVRYPNCEHRAYEGLKTLVFLGVSETQALRWKSIDPHFRGPSQTQQAVVKGHAILLDVHQREATEAPSPAARFPGDEAGWTDALAYARGKDS